eukprot:COSAG01_NODE_1427_length_10336_cov_12.761207_7_plen_70_part_00
MTAEVLGWPRTAPGALNMPIPGTAQLGPLWGLRYGGARAGPASTARGCPPKSGAAEPRGKAPALAFEMS